MVQLVYPHLEFGQEYALGAAEEPWWEVSGPPPLDLLGGSPLYQVGCYIATWNMAESAVRA